MIPAPTTTTFHLCLFFLVLALVTTTLVAQEPPKIKAAVSETINRGFIVDEKVLRKLNELLKQRFSEKANHYTITYTIKLNNGFYYDTNTIETVLSEENTAPREVLTCDIAARAVPDINYAGPITDEQRQKLEEALVKLQIGETPEVTIHLGNDGIIYSIRGADRDWVLNTQVDLADRLKSSNLFPDISLIVGAVVGLIAIIGVFRVLAGRLRNSYDARLRAKDPSHKRTRLIDYVHSISDPDLSVARNAFTFQSAIFLGSFVGLGTFQAIRVLYPQHVFLLGVGIETYSRLVNIRQYLMNGIIISLVIGVIASVIANLATRQSGPT